ncbi:MAG: phosphotransferase [Bacillaceae bacterium]|nr:phosphotransferase [Bacillaceae bacterium]
MKQLRHTLENHYGFQVKRANVIKDNSGSSFVARIKTSDGQKFALKTLYLTEKRQKFIVYTEKLLQQKGVELAKPVPTQDGRLYFFHDGSPYVLYNWTSGNSHPLKKEKHLLNMIKTVARFHKKSKGLKYPDDVTLYSHLDWKQEYRQRIHNMQNWRHYYEQTTDPKKQYILQHLSYFIKVAEKAYQYLLKSDYDDIVSQPFNEQTLVHGDYHQNNVMRHNKKNVLFDFEDVRYDLPSRDIQRILSMYTRTNPFSQKLFNNVIRTYEKKHPLTLNMKHIIYIDLYFPHIIEHMLRKKKYLKADMKRMKHIIKQERKKAKCLEKYLT